MKIVYLTNSDIRGNEPGVSFASHNAAGFKAAGADLTLVAAGTPATGASAVLQSRFGVDVTIELVQPRKLLGSRAPFYLEIRKVLERIQPDVVISRNLNVFPYIKSWAVKQEVALFFEAHDFYHDLSKRSPEQAKKLRRKQRLEIATIPSVSGVICVSEAQAKCYREAYPNARVLTASTGCRNPDPISISEFEYNIGYVGSMTEGKYQVERLIEALSLTKWQQVSLIAAGGKAADIERLNRLASDLGVGDRVAIHGWKTGAELEALMSKVDVMSAPLNEHDFLNQIASPLKVLDAFSRSKPVIASKLTGIAALVTDGVHGQLISNEAFAWAEAINDIYRDFENYLLMSEACSKRAMELSWENRAKKITFFIKVDSNKK